MIKSNNIKTELEARMFAQDCLKHAICYLAKGLNACDEIASYRYADHEQERLKLLAIELFDLLDNGKIEMLLARNASQDKQFQAFMKKVV